MAKIYTKTGDKGETGLVGGQRVKKNDARIEAYGTIDELNASIGLIRSELEKIIRSVTSGTPLSSPVRDPVDSVANVYADLERIQHWLFNLGSLIATDPKEREKFKLVPVSDKAVSFIEERIDSLNAVLKPLNQFILPGGSESSARAHQARTIARRAERCMMAVFDQLPEHGLELINRLSDYFFVLARFFNHLENHDDVVWQKDLKLS